MTLWLSDWLSEGVSDWLNEWLICIYLKCILHHEGIIMNVSKLLEMRPWVLAVICVGSLKWYYGHLTVWRRLSQPLCLFLVWSLHIHLYLLMQHQPTKTICWKEQNNPFECQPYFRFDNWRQKWFDERCESKCSFHADSFIRHKDTILFYGSFRLRGLGESCKI